MSKQFARSYLAAFERELRELLLSGKLTGEEAKRLVSEELPRIIKKVGRILKKPAKRKMPPIVIHKGRSDPTPAGFTDAEDAVVKEKIIEVREGNEVDWKSLEPNVQAALKKALEIQQRESRILGNHKTARLFREQLERRKP